MKLKITDVTQFKKELLAQIIEEWTAIADAAESQARLAVEAESEEPAPYSNFSPRELAEQKFRLGSSAIRSSINELKSAALPPASTDVIGVFSLFDVTTTELNQSKTTTYFVLPLGALQKGYTQIRLGKETVALADRTHPFIGRKQGDRERTEGGPLWEEPHMGHVVYTGKSSNPVTYSVSWVYR